MKTTFITSNTSMNLWSELDNVHTPDEAAERGQGLRARRLSESFLLAEMRAWLLRDYVAPYCQALAASRIYRRCYWLDAWGGDTRAIVTPTVPVKTHNGAQSAKRRKKDAAPTLPATLLPVVTLSETLAQGERPIALQGLVLATGSSKRGTRKEAATSRIMPKESGLIAASWLEAAPTLLQAIESSPAIFLLNPFNAQMFTHDDLTPLYQRVSAPTELCLLILHKTAETRLLSSARTPEGGAALTALLRTDRWKTLLPISSPIKHRAQPAQMLSPLSPSSPFLDGIIELLVAAMQRHFLAVQRIAFPVQTRPAVVEDAPCTLLFATRSKESVLCMNDAVCLHRRCVIAQSYTGLLNEAWFARQQQERDAVEQEQLRALIARSESVQRSRRWPELRQHLILSHFGRYSVQEYDAALETL